MSELDKRIEGILLQRLTQIIRVWCSEFDRVDDGDTRRDPLPLRDITNKRRGDKRSKDEKVSVVPVVRVGLCGLMGFFFAQFMEHHMVLKPIVHEIRIQNQVIFLDPPIEYARESWIKQLHDWLGKIYSYFRRRFISNARSDRCGLQAAAYTEFAV